MYKDENVSTYFYKMGLNLIFVLEIAKKKKMCAKLLDEINIHSKIFVIKFAGLGADKLKLRLLTQS